MAEEVYEEVSPAQLLEWLRDGKATRLIDVREPEEWEFCHLPGAELLPLQGIQDWSQRLDPEQELLLYCHHGIRSLFAALYLAGKGFRRVVNLRGGLDAYSLEADPAFPRY